MVLWNMPGIAQHVCGISEIFQIFTDIPYENCFLEKNESFSFEITCVDLRILWWGSSTPFGLPFPPPVQF